MGWVTDWTRCEALLGAPLGVRATATASFAALALAISVVLAVGTYLTARHFLVEQRQATAARQAFVDAAFVRDGLLTSGSEVSDVLDSTSPPPGAVIIVNRGGRWYSSSLDDGADAVPAGVRELVDDGQCRTGVGEPRRGQPVLAVGVPIPSVGATFYELSPTTELDSTLRTLGAGPGRVRRPDHHRRRSDRALGLRARRRSP